VFPVHLHPVGDATGGGPRTGTLKVRLFDEPNRASKDAVVKEAVAEFTAAHTGATVDVAYIPVETRSARFKGASTLMTVPVLVFFLLVRR
jgi:N,N'-diacetylchitobiose transport system substrate-binding protein